MPKVYTVKRVGYDSLASITSILLYVKHLSFDNTVLLDAQVTELYYYDSD